MADSTGFFSGNSPFISQSMFGNIGGGISDIFAAEAAGTKAEGDELEARQYDLAAQYAEQEKKYTEISTGIQLAQQTRQSYQSIGRLTAGVAASGFSTGGSGLDLLRDSAQQGALQRATLQEQGLITEQGYEEQAQSYRTMEGAAQLAAHAERTAGLGEEIAGGVKLAAAFLPLTGF